MPNRTPEGYILRGTSGYNNYATDEAAEGWNASVRSDSYDPPPGVSKYYAQGWVQARYYKLGFQEAKRMVLETISEALNHMKG